MTLAVTVGLAIALGGPALLASPAHRVLGPPERLVTKLLDQLALWSMFAAIIAVVLVWEGRPLTSIGLQPFDWGSLAWGVALAVGLITVVAPIATWVVAVLGLSGFESGLAKVLPLPIWFRLIAVITAGVVEETLFRGYAVERLALLTGSYWWAGILSLTAFALVHLPFWGKGPMLTVFFTGGLLTAFFVWRQDLLANIVAHGVMDAMGLVIMPLLSRRTTQSSS